MLMAVGFFALFLEGSLRFFIFFIKEVGPGRVNSAELQTLIVKLMMPGSLGFVLLLSSFVCLLQSLVTLGPVQSVEP